MDRSQGNFLARAYRRLLFRTVELYLRTATSEYSIASGTRKVTMTLIALVVAASIVLVPSLRSAADEFGALETLLTALGATYGTVIALVLTLSIIPVERAGEAWSASIVRLAMENEKAAGGSSGLLPLGSVYSPADPASLGWDFVRSVAGLYMAEDEAGFQAEYRLLLQVQEAYSNHLRSVARNNEFGGSALVRDIDRMIKQIGVAIVDLVDKPAPFDRGNLDELVSGFTGFLGFYPSAFREKRSVDARRAEECSDSLVYVGLRFASVGHPIVLRHCIRCVRSIVGSICESIEPANFPALGGVLALLWGVREARVAGNEPDIEHELDRALDRPANVGDGVWRQAQPAVGLRREEFRKRMAEGSEPANRENAETLLRTLMGGIGAGD